MSTTNKIDQVKADVPATVDLTKLSQSDVPTLLEMARTKLKELKGDSSDKDVKMATTFFPGIGDLSKNDIELTDLIKAYSSILAREDYYTQACTALGANIKKHPLMEEKVSAEQWKSYIEKRYVVVANRKEIAKYEETIKQLETVLSEEDKVRNTLSKIAQIFTED